MLRFRPLCFLLGWFIRVSALVKAAVHVQGMTGDVGALDGQEAYAVVAASARYNSRPVPRSTRRCHWRCRVPEAVSALFDTMPPVTDTGRSRASSPVQRNLSDRVSTA